MSILPKLRILFRDDETHFVQLAQHFFHRFFDNEFITRDGEARLTVVHILALLAVPGLFYTMYLYPNYFDIALYFPASFPTVAMIDRCRYISFTIVVIGFVAVLDWDALFPDRRDYSTLTVLPLETRTIFAAKLAALAVFLALFIAVVNAVPTILFPCVELEGRPGTLGDLAWSIAVHAATVIAASAFMFLFFVALQGLFINLLSPRAFKQISIYIQAIFMVALLCLFFLLPMISSLLPEWKRANSLALYWLPPMWFLGLYETLLGTSDAAFHSLAEIAVAAFFAVILISLATYLFTYRRHAQRSLESPHAVSGGLAGSKTFLGRLLDRFVLRTPLERAAFSFVARTLARSGKHRLYLATYVGVGFAFALEGILELLLKSSGLGEIYQPGEALLSVPLLFSFFVLSGMRMLFALPAELRSNWAFRITEDANPKNFLSGVRKAMLALGVAPLFALLFPVSAYLWGWQTALFHLIFGLALSLVLVEVLLLKFRRIPFACSYLPGKANITLLGVFYWLAFTTYAYSMASLEARLLRDPILLVIFMVLILAVLAGLVAYRNRQLAAGFTFVFEDQPDPVVRRLGLAESSAGQDG